MTYNGPLTHTPSTSGRPSCLRYPTCAAPRLRHTRVLLAVCDRERRRNLLRIVQWRDAFEERAYVRVRFIIVLAPSLVTPPVHCVLEEGRPMGDAKIGQSACELGRKMHQRGLRCSFLSLTASKATRRCENKSYVDHVAAICELLFQSRRFKIMQEMRTGSAHDGYPRRYKLILHILVDVVQERPDISEER